MCDVRMSGLGLFLSLALSGLFPVSPPPLLRLSVPIHLPLPLPHSFAPPDGVFLRRPVTQLNVSGLLPVSFFSLFTLFLWSCQVTRTVQNSNCSCLSYENMHFSSLSLSSLSFCLCSDQTLEPFVYQMWLWVQDSLRESLVISHINCSDEPN